MYFSFAFSIFSVLYITKEFLTLVSVLYEIHKTLFQMDKAEEKDDPPEANIQ